MAIMAAAAAVTRAKLPHAARTWMDITIGKPVTATRAWL
jgi:hypothetical protein